MFRPIVQFSIVLRDAEDKQIWLEMERLVKLTQYPKIHVLYTNKKWCKSRTYINFR